MSIRKFSTILFAGVLLSSCGVVKRGTIPWESNPPISNPESIPLASTPTPFVSKNDSKNEKEIKESLEVAYKDWKGVPYLLGGSGYSGIDCSAFMQVIFEDYFSRKIPRTTREQMGVGKNIRKKNVSTGDMVFFKTGAKTYHVGVMVNNEQFLHASTSSGVMISNLNDRYWQETYLTTRRIL